MSLSNYPHIGVLLDMLTYCRPAGSASEQVFIHKYVATLPGAEPDACRNWHVHVGPEDHPVLWSCHTDTVHRRTDAARQTVHVSKQGFVRLSRKAQRHSSCLGADDTAGVFLLREMILAGVAGHYTFHYGEEVGGIGSRDLVATYPAWCQRFQAAIALDRGRCSDVITHQSGGRCCSDDFADSLIAALGLPLVKATGTYTDTAEYADIVPECSNISVGYFGAHSRHEELYLPYLYRLRTALLQLDQTALRFSRDPYSYDADSWHSYCQGILLDWPEESDVIEIPATDGDRSHDPDADAYLDPEYAAVVRALRLVK